MQSDSPAVSLGERTGAGDKGVCGLVCSYFNLSGTQAVSCHKIMRWQLKIKGIPLSHRETAESTSSGIFICYPIHAL